MAVTLRQNIITIVHDSSASGLSSGCRVTALDAVGQIAAGDDLAWSYSSSAPESLGFKDFDLTALVDDRGTATFTSVTSLTIRCRAGEVSLPDTGSKPTNFWGGTPVDMAGGGVDLASGGVIALSLPAEGIDPVTSTSKILRIVCGSGSPQFDIVLVGKGSIA